MKQDFLKVKGEYLKRVRETKQELKQMDISRTPFKEIPLINDISVLAVIYNTTNRGVI